MAAPQAECQRVPRPLLGWITAVMVACCLAAGMTLTIWIDVTWPRHVILGALPAAAGAVFTLGIIILGTG